jgi:hypothetical protein
MASLFDCKDPEWLEAQAQLAAARNMAAGPERIEALRCAGELRSLACQKLIEKDNDDEQ